MSEQPIPAAGEPIAPEAAPYGVLALALETVRSTLGADDTAAGEVKPALETVRQAVTQLPEGVGLEQSLQVEIHKQLRLLEMDWAFLRTARQVATVNQRRSAMLDRVGVLMGYCTTGISLRAASVVGQGEA